MKRNQITYCKKCGQVMYKNAKICPACGAKNKRPIYKKIWFWVIIAILLIGGIGSDGDEEKVALDKDANIVETENIDTSLSDADEVENTESEGTVEEDSKPDSAFEDVTDEITTEVEESLEEKIVTLDESKDVTDSEDTEEIEDLEEPEFYSTNTKEVAKNGNSGIFAYKEDGKFYDTYYIINFDEKYVYNFREGQGEMYGDRAAIVSGDLNKGIVVTYHDSGTSWSYNFHFKNSEQPEILVLIDNDKFDYTYKATDLETALKLMETKNITTY